MNTTDLYTAVEAFLADQPYYPCCLLVSPEIEQVRRAQEALERRYHWPTISIGAELSEALLARGPEARPQAVKPILAGALQRLGAEPVVCAEIDLLFEPALALDPLALLRDLSRSVRLVALWPGAISGNTLAYATPQHARYRTWPTSGLAPTCLIPV